MLPRHRIVDRLRYLRDHLARQIGVDAGHKACWNDRPGEDLIRRHRVLKSVRIVDVRIYGLIKERKLARLPIGVLRERGAECGFIARDEIDCRWPGRRQRRSFRCVALSRSRAIV